MAGFAVAGNYLGHNAKASAAPGVQWTNSVTPASAIASKASLLSEASLLGGDASPSILEQTVMASAKSDYLVDRSIVANAPEDDKALPLGRLAATPAVWKLEKSWKIGQAKKRKMLAKRRFRLAEKNCLARAIYFEARSEPEAGQLAVAKVIMNRVKDPQYPNSICGVVYQGAERRNSCQFSFACDGRSDDPKSRKSWRRSKQIASRAFKSSDGVKVISAATHYHADYVRPKWSGSMKRLIKIGRHIFYHDS